ncbi:MAG: hypothetical protein U5Q03_01070 [Bacteroidota bacterium]|nr:hypothetical protein [Bacteroidota bacterium]
MMQFWQIIKNNGDLLIIGIILLIVFILFIRDFDLKSKRAWMILLGLSSLGAFIFYKAINKNRLLKELQQREKKLQELEKEYESLKKRHEISEENYRLAKKELEDAKKKTAMDMLLADEKYREEVEKINEDFENITSDELLEMTAEILKSN